MPLLGGATLEFCKDIWHQKTAVPGLSLKHCLHYRRFSRFDTISECDRHSVDAEIAWHVSVGIIPSSVTAWATWQRHCCRQSFNTAMLCDADGCGQSVTLHIFDTPLVFLVEYGITRYYNPDQVWHEGSQDTNLSCHEPISTSPMLQMDGQMDIKLVA